MGFDGGHRAGYMQVAQMVDSDLIGPSTKSTAETTCPGAHGWTDIEILSTGGAVFASITAPGLAGSSRIDSGTTYVQYWNLKCSKITAFKFTSETSGFLAIAHRRILL